MRLYENLIERLDEEKLNKIYEYFEKPMVKILAKLEFNGTKFGKGRYKALHKDEALDVG